MTKTDEYRAALRTLPAAGWENLRHARLRRADPERHARLIARIGG